MRGFRRGVFALSCLLVIPAASYAQATLTGTVKDASGAVIPGVTVEASSPVLIEKVRTAVTDGNGRYQIVDLRPGDYTVSFALTGFTVVKRGGIQLAGTAFLTVDAEMRVGGVAETVTVTGESPVIDVRTATKQTVLDREMVQAIPSGRNYYNLGALVTGVASNSADVGGALGDTMSSLMAHGSKAVDQRVTNNGVSIMTLQAGGNIGGATPDVSSASEITVDTSAVSADLPTGGVRVNLIPRDGGNRFASSNYFTFSTEGMQADNFTSRLKATGLVSVDKNKKIWDINPSFGGPLKKDKVWFWLTGRHNGIQSIPGGIFANKNAWNPNAWLYEADPSQEVLNKGIWHSLQLRMTYQANQKNKIAATWQEQNYCRCPFFIGAGTGGALAAPETAQDRRFPRLQQQHVEWTSPITNKLLVEAVGMHLFERWGNMHLRQGDGTFFTTGGSLTDPVAIANMPLMIPVLEQSNNMLYRGGPASGGNVNNNFFNNTEVPNYFYRAALSYVTGTHNFKAGFNNVIGYLKVTSYDFQPVTYRFSNGVPNLITLRAGPSTLQANENSDFGLFVQDRWALDRWTLTGGLRFDSFNTSFPEQVIGPGALVPNRNITFPARDNLAWKDVTYRSAAAWDVFGTGKTAVKLTLNKYLNGQTLNALGGDPNPFNTLINATTRSWDDRGGKGINGDYKPQCDLLNPAANLECGPMQNPNFGKSIPGASFDPDLLTGWGHRSYNWEFSASVQHEILPRVSVDVGYFRRWFGNFRVIDNQALAPSDFDQFSLMVPTDSRLPNGGGYTVTGLYNVKPELFTKPAQNFNTLSDKYGNQIEHWNGIDVSVNARLATGVTLAGGIGTGKRVTDNCEVVAKIPEMLFADNALIVNSPIDLTDANPNVWLPGQWCHQEEPFLTQGKLFGRYVIPRIDVQVSGSFQSFIGSSSVPQASGLIAANYVVTNAILASSSTLGRSLAGNQANMTVNIVEPGSTYLERVNELDFRVGKVFKYGRNRAAVNLDLYNAFNADTKRAVNFTYSPTTTVWQRPTTVLLARFAKISMTLDF